MQILNIVKNKSTVKVNDEMKTYCARIWNPIYALQFTGFGNNAIPNWYWQERAPFFSLVGENQMNQWK